MSTVLESEESKNIKEFFGAEVYSNAAKERGLAFMEGFELIVKSTNMDSAHQKIALDRLEMIRKKWEGWGTDKTNNQYNEDSIKALMGVLGKELASQIPEFKDKKLLKKALEHAENHVQWKPREQVRNIIDLGVKKEFYQYYQVRVDTPITALTREQTEEWLKILDTTNAPKPKWFTQLAQWEQNHLISRVRSWNEGDKQKNLGDFLGVPPTTVRGYPGARNAYVSTFTTYRKNPLTGQTSQVGETMVKIRTGHVVPDKMKNKAERLKQTKENIKQLMLIQIKEQLEKSNNVIISLQTLITPMPLNEQKAMNDIRKQAVRELQDEFGNAAHFRTFLRNNGSDNTNRTPVLTLITSNHSVNAGRFFFGSHTEENSQALKTLKGLQAIAPQTKEKTIAKEALDKIDRISGRLQRMGNFLTKGINYNSERAALEQIAVDALGGVRIGSCMSGKDREGAVSMHVAAMTAFYAEHKKFPPIPSRFRRLDKEDRKLRKEYETMVAKQFISGHDTIIAEVNAKGARGIKGVNTILGKNIMKEAATLITGITGESLTSKEVASRSKKPAGLNKPGKIKKIKLKKYRKIKKIQKYLKSGVSGFSPEDMKAINHRLEKDESTKGITCEINEQKKVDFFSADDKNDANLLPAVRGCNVPILQKGHYILVIPLMEGDTQDKHPKAIARAINIMDQNKELKVNKVNIAAVQIGDKKYTEQEFQDILKKHQSEPVSPSPPLLRTSSSSTRASSAAEVSEPATPSSHPSPGSAARKFK